MSSDYVPFKHQVAGHKGSLSDASGVLFIKPATSQEIQFYTQITEKEGGQNEDQNEGMKLIDWMPTFLGTLQNGLSPNLPQTQEIQNQLNELSFDQIHSQVNNDDSTYLVLENLLNGFNKPCIVDIKLGSKLTDNTASEEKRQRLANVSSSTTSGSLSYRICGMKIHTGSTNIEIPKSLADLKKFITVDSEGYTVFDKYYGRALTKDTVKDNFEMFFKSCQLSHEQRKIVIRNTLIRLQILYNCLLDKEVRIISGSLLIVFEADLNRWKQLDNDDTIFRNDDFLEEEEEEEDDDDYEEEQESRRTPLSLLSMIDFAHSRISPGEGYDENIIAGVENLINLLEDLIIDNIDG